MHTVAQTAIRMSVEVCTTGRSWPIIIKQDSDSCYQKFQKELTTAVLWDEALSASNARSVRIFLTYEATTMQCETDQQRKSHATRINNFY